MQCNSSLCFYGKTLAISQLEMRSFITTFFSFIACFSLDSPARRQFLTKGHKRREERGCHYKREEGESHFGFPLVSIIRFSLNTAMGQFLPFSFNAGDASHGLRYISWVYIHKLWNSDVALEQVWMDIKTSSLAAYDKWPKALALGHIIIINELDGWKRQRGWAHSISKAPGEKKGPLLTTVNIPQLILARIQSLPSKELARGYMQLPRKT